MSPSWEAKNSMEEFGPYATYQAAVDAKARIRGEMPQDFTQINITGNDATGRKVLDRRPSSLPDWRNW